MIIILSPEKYIYDIKKIFRQAYPYLKMEFFRKNMPGEIVGSEIMPDTMSLFDLTGFKRETEIEILQCKTVTEIKSAFLTKYNLSIQIFRRSRFDWIDTSETDYLTLEKQNKWGRAACDKMYETSVLL